MAKEEVVHQHTVPVCYLANFGVDGNKGRKSKIYFFNVVDRKYGLASVEKMPVENCFYDIEELGEDKQIIENLLGEVEGNFAELLRKILGSVIIDEKERTENKISLTDSERKQLSFQLAMQITRSRDFRNYFENFYLELKNSFNGFVEIPEYTKDDFQRWHTTDILSFRSSKFYTNLLDDRHVLLLINHTDVPFITSDNPVIEIDNRKVQDQPISPASKEITFFFPLSPDVAIEVFHKELLKEDLLCLDIYCEKIIATYNYNLINNATRFLFSDKNLNPKINEE